MEREIIGLISDTHGLLRPEAIAAFKGAGLILHAGDIGGAEILQGLGGIAPVIAVRGNNDRGAWAGRLPETRIVEVKGRRFYLLHDLKALDLDPAVAGFAGVISGHSHRPLIEKRGGVLFFNPGSAGPRRFKLPVSVGFISIRGADLNAEVKTIL